MSSIEELVADVKRLKESNALLEAREQNVRAEHADIERYTMSFIKKALSIFLAYSFSQMVYQWLMVTHDDAVMAHLVYAVLMCFVTPGILVALHGDENTPGASILGDFLSLIHSSAPMLLAWGVKDPKH